MHFLGIYLVGFVSSLVVAITYFMYTWFFQKPVSFQIFSFACICGAFHWIVFTIIEYATMFACAHLLHGLILTFLACSLNRLLKVQNQTHLKTWLQNQLTISRHLRFAKLLSGTEAFCVYLLFLGAKVGKHCSIRDINPVLKP